MSDQILYYTDDSKDKKRNNNVPVLIALVIILLITTLYLGYDKFFNKKSEDTQNNNEVTTESFSLNFSLLDQIDEKIGNLFFWIKDSKLDNMNKLDNDIKVCLAERNAITDVNDETVSAPSYSKTAIENGLKRVFNNNETIEHKDLQRILYEPSDCFFPYHYDEEEEIYEVVATGLEGPLGIVEKKVLKVDKVDDNYIIYVQAIYRDSDGNVYADNDVTKPSIAKFELMSDTDLQLMDISTEGKYLEEYVSSGYTYKLTFVEKNNELYWTKYEVIK